MYREHALGNDQAKARRVLDKVKRNVDVGHLSLKQQEKWTVRLVIVGTFLLLITGLAALSVNGSPEVRKVDPAISPSPLPEPTPATINHSLNATDGAVRDEDFVWTAPVNTKIVSVEPHEVANSDGIRNVSIKEQTADRFVAHFHAESQQTKAAGIVVDTHNALLNVDFKVVLRRASAVNVSQNEVRDRVTPNIAVREVVDSTVTIGDNNRVESKR